MSGLQLFASGHKRKREATSGDPANTVSTSSDAASAPKKVVSSSKATENWTSRDDAYDDSTRASSFASIGVPAWLVKVCRAVGITVPTPIQAAVIPTLLSQPGTSIGAGSVGKHAARDVIGCAQTGSGKTAAFALPILSSLVTDPYGPFALVLTPSRELAVQIKEQFNAFGTAAHVRVCCIVGGCDIVTQAKELASAPHIIVATPGRLAHHISLGVTKIDLSKLAFLVLDEADRLLEPPFAPDLSTVLTAAKGSLTKRRTLLFSATMPPDVISDVTATSTTLEEGSHVTKEIRELLGIKNPLCVDVTPKDITAAVTVPTLKQMYVFMPAMVKNAYLWHVLDMYISPSALPESLRKSSSRAKSKPGKGKKQLRAVTASAAMSEAAAAADEDESIAHARSIIIFTSTCRACQMVTEMLIELGIPCTPLHSVMAQAKRLASLAKFKSALVPVLVATDVASRGLDIPTVDLVVNYDLPQVPSDYIHRVGRTARAGRGGCAISFVTQYDVELIKTIEKEVLHGREMTAVPNLVEDDVLPRLTKVATAYQMAKLRLEDHGFEDKLITHTARKKEAAAKSRAFIQRDKAA